MSIGQVCMFLCSEVFVNDFFIPTYGEIQIHFFFNKNMNLHNSPVDISNALF